MQTPQRTCGVLFSIQLAAKTTGILQRYKDAEALIRHWYPTLRIRKESMLQGYGYLCWNIFKVASLHLDYKRTHLTKQLTNPCTLFQQTRQQRTWITSHINEPSSAMHLPICRSTPNDKPMKSIYIFDKKILQNVHVHTLDTAYHTPTQIHVVQPSMEQLSTASKFPWTCLLEALQATKERSRI